MAYRIYQDQENRGIPELRQKPGNMAPGAQKRSALSVLNTNAARPVQVKDKKPLGLAVRNGAAKPVKVVTKNNVAPVVPVAQFQAFKVYEDSPDVKTNAETKVKEIEKPKPLLPAPTLPAILPKKEWFVQDCKADPLQEIIKPEPGILLKSIFANEGKNDVVIESPDVPREIPMSIGKICNESCDDVSMILLKTPTELFFENEEYRNDIYSYLRKHEMVNRPKPYYMRKQPDITYSMRTILVDWLVEVAEEYKLQCETLFLAINYIDRFLSYMSVVRGKLQLVGTAAMFIAAKYEEIYPPEVGEFVYITDDTYTKKQVIRMEHLILKVLSFDLSVPTPLSFIKVMSVATSMSDKVTFLAMYLSELAMLETDPYLEILPSLMAASSIAVARYITELEEPWPNDLKRNTGYDVTDLKKSMEFLYLLFCKAPSQAQQAIQEKYNSSKYLHVSKITPKNECIKIDE